MIVEPEIGKFTFVTNIRRQSPFVLLKWVIVSIILVVETSFTCTGFAMVELWGGIREITSFG